MDSIDLMNQPASLAADLEHLLPEINDAFGSIIRELPLPWAEILNSEPGFPIATVTNQLFNDVLDLLIDLRACRGRSALRTTRAIFELLLTLMDVSGDADAAWRYERHQVVAYKLLAEADLGLDRLPAKQGSAARHQIRKQARDTKADLESAINDYGNSYVGRWSRLDLSARARNHDRETDYAFYRLSSMTIHGSAGGAEGTTRRNIGIHPVHRLGMNLQAAPIAYLKGLGFFVDALDHLAGLPANFAVSRLRAACIQAVELWPNYRSTVLTLDQQIWPSEPPVNPFTILAVDRQGRRRWFIQDTFTGELVDAVAPTPDAIPDEMERAVQRVLERSEPATRIDDWLTFTMTGVSVHQDPNGRRHPASRFLPAKERRLPEPIRHARSDVETQEIGGVIQSVMGGP